MYIRRSEALGYLSIKLLIVNIMLLLLVSFGVIIISVVKHLVQVRPSASGKGYHNQSYYKIETRTIECTVLNPVVECKSSNHSCVAQVQYLTTKQEQMTSVTFNTFSPTSKYASYKSGQSVTCFYDKYRMDLVSYEPLTNANMKYLGMVLSLIFANGLILTLELVAIILYAIYRRRKWQKLYEGI